jgi:hypothetical protein
VVGLLNLDDYSAEQDAAIAFCYKTLNSLGMTGRLRIAREVRCCWVCCYPSFSLLTNRLFPKSRFRYVSSFLVLVSTLLSVTVHCLLQQGYNCTLTGTYQTVRQFTDALRVRIHLRCVSCALWSVVVFSSAMLTCPRKTYRCVICNTIIRHAFMYHASDASE